MRIDIQVNLLEAVTIIIKRIEHTLQHNDEKDILMIKKVFEKKNKPYIDFIVWLIKYTKSFDFELRLRCVALIKLFENSHNVSLLFYCLLKGLNFLFFVLLIIC